MLEFGWTSDPRPDSPYYWHAVDERRRPTTWCGAYQYAKANWSPWIGLMSLIYIGNPDWTENDEQWYWSITNPDIGSPRTAYVLAVRDAQVGVSGGAMTPRPPERTMKSPCR